jgi:Bacterial Ig-like domain (group 3)/FG-GAP-like repeat
MPQAHPLRLFLAATLLLALPAYAYFPEWPRIDAIAGADVRQLVAADFNGDGIPDLAARAGTNRVLLSLVAAGGELQPLTEVYSGGELFDLIVADVDGDGDGDLIAADTFTNSLVVLTANGDGTFAAAAVSPLTVVPSELVAGEFTGDGKLDVAVRSIESVLVILAGDGVARFTEASRIELDLPVLAYAVTAGRADGDERDDLLIAYAGQFDLYFGRAGGLFDAPVTVPAPSEPEGDVLLADLDDDGDSEIVATHDRVSVWVNGGSRTFAAAQDYFTDEAPVGMVVGDFSDDGHADVVVLLPEQRVSGTLRGKGDGRLDPVHFAPTVVFGSRVFPTPECFAAADFTGDGRPDLAVIAQSELVDDEQLNLFGNAAGDVQLVVRPQYPTMNPGEPVKVRVFLGLTPGYTNWYGTDPPPPTGTITLKSSSGVNITLPLTGHNAELNLGSLPLGTHTLTATFAGDGEYRAAQSVPVTQTITERTTTVTLTSSVPSGVEYGTQWTLTAAATSSTGAALEGFFRLYRDGVEVDSVTSSPWSPPKFTESDLKPGTYKYQVRFEGTATEPPGTSGIVTQVISKRSTTTIINLTEAFVRPGQRPTLTVSVPLDWNTSVRLYNGSTLLSRIEVDENYQLPALPVGTHYLRAVYDGNELNEGSESFARFTVMPGDAFLLDVSAAPQWIAARGFYPSLPERGWFAVYRRIGNGPWTIWIPRTSVVSQLTEFAPPFNTVYQYRLEAYDASNELLASSNIELAMRVTFTDEVFNGPKTVKAVHVKELVAAINVVRATAGLPPVAITDAGAGKRIRAAHIVALRNAINQARTALGAPPAPFTADVAGGAVIRLRHLQELRDAIR